MRARNVLILMGIWRGRQFFHAWLVPQMEMLEFAQLAPCLAMMAMRYSSVLLRVEDFILTNVKYITSSYALFNDNFFIFIFISELYQWFLLWMRVHHYNGKAKLDVQYMRVEGSFFVLFFISFWFFWRVDVSKMWVGFDGIKFHEFFFWWGGGRGGRWSLHGLNWPQQKKMVMIVSFLYVCLFYYVRMD